MREILFRGKSVNKDIGWVEGSLLITNYEPAFTCYTIENTTHGIGSNSFMSGISEVVDPETVGQYTGLKDKNGKMIFEGDVVDIIPENEEIGVIEWADGEAVFVINGDGWCATFDNYYPYDVEVVGNIHDNPSW